MDFFLDFQRVKASDRDENLLDIQESSCEQQDIDDEVTLDIEE